MGILDIAIAVFIGKLAFEVVHDIYYEIKHRIKKKFDPKYRELFEVDSKYIHSEDCICR